MIDTHPTDGVSVNWRKVVYRLAQHVGDRPGVYPATLVVDDDGRLALVVEAGKVEHIGYLRAGEGERNV